MAHFSASSLLDDSPCQRLIEQARQAGDRAAEARAWYELGRLRRQADPAAAEQAYRRSLACAEGLDQPLESGLALARLAEVLHLQGKAAAAADHYVRALALFPEGADLGDLPGEVWNNLGGAWQALGRVEAAAAAFRKSLEHRRRRGDLAGQSKALNNLGVARALLRQHAEAEESYREALALKERLGDALGAAQVWQNLALLHHQTGDRSAAVRCQQKAARLFDEAGTGPARVMAHLLLSRLRKRGRPAAGAAA